MKKPASWWRKVLFSDEKKYYIFSLKRTQWCLPDEEPKPQPTFAVPPQVYVWGGISYTGRTPLHRISGGLTKEKYIDVLEEALIPSVPDFAEDPDDWVFQQDQTCRGAHGRSCCSGLGPRQLPGHDLSVARQLT